MSALASLLSWYTVGRWCHLGEQVAEEATLINAQTSVRSKGKIGGRVVKA